jgi:predicted kinase
MMATLHMIYGFVGAGKTTFAKKLEHSLPAIRFTHDEWMNKLYGDNPPREHFADYYSKVQDLIWVYAIRLLELKQDVILDAGFWSRISRDEARAKAKALGTATKLYFLDVPEKVMQERVRQRNKNLQGSLYIDDQAFEGFKARFEPLGKDEAYIAVSTTNEEKRNP